MFDENLFRERVEKALKRGVNDILTEKELGKVKVVECGEKLTKITDVCENAEIRMIKPRLEFAGESVLYARESVCKMLSQVEQNLPSKHSLIIHDAFRPVEYQQKRFDEHLKKFKNDLEYTSRFIAPPSLNPQTPPPHSTGGAIDLTLSLDKLPLDMGTKYADYSTAEKRAMIPTNSKLVNAEQRENRVFLLENMLRVGFVNYPGEWWHFSYGDREWAVYEGKPHAIFGRAKIRF